MNHHRHPQPFCRVGDVVEFTMSVTTTPWPGEREVRIDAGDRYRAVGLVESGWDLERLSGTGPDYLRIINTEMPKYVTVVSEP